MKALKLSEITRVLGAKMLGNDVTVNTISTDTRSLQPGDLFVSLTGENFDGHDFLEQARTKGAAAAMIAKDVATDLPAIRVADTRQALGKMATYLRTEAHIPLIAITGSCGKTTARAMLSAIMATQGPVLASQRSFNNDIGMPLTLLQQQPEHRYAVLEMGTNHFGELAYLTAIAKPDIAVIINIASAHLEGFGDLDGVSRAKGEIFQGLRSDGTAIINIDDHYADYFRTLVGDRKVVTFAINKPADVRGSNIQVDNNGLPRFTLQMGEQQTLIHLTTVGEHNVVNALAACACAHALGVSIEAMKEGLESVVPVDKRMIWRTGKQGVRIIDDSYNAIPDAVHAAMKVLAGQAGEKVFVFGGMAELGSHVETVHREIGNAARTLGIHSLYAIGQYSHLTVEAFGNKGKHFSNKQQLIEAVQEIMQPSMTILVKGSRGAKMEEVVAALTLNI